MKQFVKPIAAYQRNYNPLGTYVNDIATYLQLMTDQPKDACVKFVRDSIKPGGRRELKIPMVNVLIRNKFGDRERHVVPFDVLLEDIFARREILSPSLTSYIHPDEKVSLLAEFIVGNLTKRNTAKHEKFEAELAADRATTAGDLVTASTKQALAAIKESMQTSLKIKNNALSGAQCSPFTPLWNKTAHSTLTSTCRTATSYGNANNEKFLMGNRHYWSPDIVTNNIISIINHSDYAAIEKTMTRLGLRAPTAEETMACIERSTRPYWRSDKHMARIAMLVSKLSEEQRSAFVFTSDLYHLSVINPGFVRQLFTDLITRPEMLLELEESRQWIKQADNNLRAFVSMLCANELASRKIKDILDDEPVCRLIGSTVKQIMQTIESNEDLIKAFWITDNLPSSVYYLPSIIRRTAITSDTDSTIFTVQHWTQWFVGKLDFSAVSIGVGNAAVYLTGQLIRHIMARFSANMGVAQKDIFRLEMKNEFYMPLFALTTRAKHYFAYVLAQEGNVYRKMKTEIKGVGLRNSNVPPVLTTSSHELMRNIMDTIIAGEMICLKQLLRFVAKKEKAIRDSVFVGNFEYLKTVNIKTKDGYKAATDGKKKSNNYDHYGMWEEVFAVKYGHAMAPPYRAIKIPLETSSPVRLREWFDKMEDQTTSQNLQAWMQHSGRKGLKQLLLPENVLMTKGVPTELVEVMDIRGTTAQVMEGFYIILECFGYFLRNDYNTRLVSDEEWLLADDWPHGELQIA